MDNNGCNEFISVNESDLKKQSIFILPYEQEKGNEQDADRDFEFFVFVDPDDDNKCPDFLKELKNCLINWEWKDGKPVKAKNGNNFFAISEHEQQLREWLGDKVDNSLITPLNWLKIAIERYPYRLFVVIDPCNWKNGDRKSPLDDAFWFDGNAHPVQPSEWKKSPILYKRICWVKKEKFDKFCNAMKGNDTDITSLFKIEFSEGSPDTDTDEITIIEKFKLWLYLNWIEHLLKRIRNFKKNIFLRINYDDSGSTNHYLRTLPPILTPVVDKKGKKVYKRIFKLNNQDLITVGEKQNSQDNDKILIAYSKHRDLLSDSKKGYIELPEEELSGEKQRDIAKCIYSEYITGLLEYYTLMINSEPPRTYSHFLTSLLMVENGLLRIGVADERILDWWEDLDEVKSAFTFSKRLIPLYWQAEDTNRQSERDNWKSIILFPQDYSVKFINEKSKLKKLFEYSYDGNELKLDAYIIHIGILQKDKEFWTKKNYEILNMKDYTPFVIITSGRGIPPELPIGTKFLPFSVLKSLLLRQEPHKFLLTKIIGTLKMEVSL